MYYGQGDIRLEEVAEPEPGPGQVKVRVGYNGICGSDLHEYYAGPLAIPTSPHPLTGAKAPVTLGHEFGGWVEAVGEGVEDLPLGSLVAVDPIHTCGQCAPCKRGATNLCVMAAFHGLMAMGGGLSDHTVVERRMVHPLPAGLDARQAALVEPMAVAFRAARRAELESGQHVLIFGGGPIGLGAFFAARWFGAHPIVVEPSGDRRRTFTDLGATTVLDPTSDDVLAAVMDITGGVGVSATIDAVALPSTFAGAFESTARGGNIVMVGIPHEPLPFDPIAMFMSEVTLRASNAYADDFPATILAMAAGAYPTDGWVTSIPFERLIPDGLEALHAGRAMKILVAFGEDLS
jgi:(R,R)-butanediol dehydrogenase / meso-butanediol dehydrogenase / diacetyl reductase